MISHNIMTTNSLTGEVKIMDYVVTIAPVDRWDIQYQAASKHFFIKLDVLEARKINKKLGKGKRTIMMTRCMGQDNFKTAARVGCAQSVIVRTYQKWSKTKKLVNLSKVHGWPRLTDERGKHSLAHVNPSNGGANTFQQKVIRTRGELHQFAYGAADWTGSPFGPCSQPNMLKMDMLTSELDHGAMEVDNVV